MVGPTASAWPAPLDQLSRRSACGRAARRATSWPAGAGSCGAQRARVGPGPNRLAEAIDAVEGRDAPVAIASASSSRTIPAGDGPLGLVRNAAVVIEDAVTAAVPPPSGGDAADRCVVPASWSHTTWCSRRPAEELPPAWPASPAAGDRHHHRGDPPPATTTSGGRGAARPRPGRGTTHVRSSRWRRSRKVRPGAC